MGVEDDVRLLAMLGVRVIGAPHLPAPDIYIPRHSLALYDTALSRDDQIASLDWVLSEVLTRSI